MSSSFPTPTQNSAQKLKKKKKKAIPSWSTFNKFNDDKYVIKPKTPNGLIPRLTERQQMRLIMCDRPHQLKVEEFEREEDKENEEMKTSPFRNDSCAGFSSSPIPKGKSIREEYVTEMDIVSEEVEYDAIEESKEELIVTQEVVETVLTEKIEKEEIKEKEVEQPTVRKEELKQKPKKKHDFFMEMPPKEEIPKLKKQIEEKKKSYQQQVHHYLNSQPCFDYQQPKTMHIGTRIHEFTLLFGLDSILKDFTIDLKIPNLKYQTALLPDLNSKMQQYFDKVKWFRKKRILLLRKQLEWIQVPTYFFKLSFQRQKVLQVLNDWKKDSKEEAEKIENVFLIDLDIACGQNNQTKYTLTIE